MDRLMEYYEPMLQAVQSKISDPNFYTQLGLVAGALVLSWIVASVIRARVKLFRIKPDGGVLYDLRATLHEARVLIQPLLLVILLAIAAPISQQMVGENWLFGAVQGVAIIIFVYSFIRHFVDSAPVIFVLKWVGVPLALLYAVGLLDDVVAHLDAIAIDIGNIKVTLYGLLRTVFFGVILFWLGRVSNVSGQSVIRKQQSLDTGTREVIAKIFEIGVFAIVFLVLMNVMGVDLTALAVFGGALGVGLGFGLQQIASNFISGIIILLDRSLTVGDFIELEDGRSGRLRELTMRSATLETFDGKDIMVPNERFITTAFVNWTHNNVKQRYPLNFQVAYDTDLEKMFSLVRETVASHPKVLSGEDVPIYERPDAEIQSFDDSGITILVEFWMEGIDDGENRVGADLLLMIWTTLQANGISIPFPQREIRMLGEDKS